MASKDDLEERVLLARLRVAVAQEMVAHSPSDPAAARELEAAFDELEAALAERAKGSDSN